MPSYNVTPAAEADLEDIWHYTASTWNVSQAPTYIREFDKAFARLAENPLICNEHPEFSPAVRIFPHAHHLIVYLLAGEEITVVRILHERMEVEERL